MILTSMCMRVVAVEMACLPDFFDHVTAKEHIAEQESDLKNFTRAALALTIA